LFSSGLSGADAPEALMSLSLEELMDVEVISPTKNPVRLGQATSAVQVIRNEDIRRSGSHTLTEALRLAPNLQVAQVNASQWASSARGFNNVLANKLLVMIDGRSVYTPLYAGVFWDVQQVLLEDVDRIEVTSGPGGTLWGANAVNGIINVISKDAEATQGLYLSAGMGTSLQDIGAVRYGGALSDTLFYRVYAQRIDWDSTLDSSTGDEANDDWYLSQGGMRVDWKPEQHNFTLQGDVYDGEPNPEGINAVDVRGANVLGRWSHAYGEHGDVRLQAYYDWTSRDFNNGFAEDLHTYDIEWQHHFQLSRRQEITWGLSYRLLDDYVTNLPLFAIEPGHERLAYYSAFLQDQLMLVDNVLYATLGSKFEHNDYTGFEYQPNFRLAWLVTESNTLWGSVARAVRTPSRIDRDFRVNLTPTFPVVETNDDFRSERVIAYELGWRTQPVDALSLSLSTFYNEYDYIRSAEPGNVILFYPITYANGVEGETYGVELAVETRLADWWRMRGGYTFLKKDLRLRHGSQDLNEASAESNDPESQALLQSMIDLPWNIQHDAVARYVDALPDPVISEYNELDDR
jgi:iron complex outermembrane receptor protein